MALYSSGSLIANVALTDTFNTWRTRFNQSVNDGVSSSANTTVAGHITLSPTYDTLGNAINVTRGNVRAEHNIVGNNAVITNNVGAKTGTFSGPVTAPVVTANSFVGTATAASSLAATSTATAPVFAANTLTANNIDLATSGLPAHTEGRIFYDSTYKTLAYYNNETETEVHIGQEEVVRVQNNTGATIEKGSAVSFNGSAGGLPTVVKCDADSSATLAFIAGLAAHDIGNGESGYVVATGLVHGVDTSAFAAGSPLYISANTPGTLVASAPQAPNYPVLMGGVINVDATEGSIFVKIEDYSPPQQYVQGNSRIGGNLTVDGDLTITGTQTTSSTTALSVGNTFIYVGRGDDIANLQFTGTGLNDMTFKDYYEGTGTKTYYVRIDSTGSPDTFMWSVDNFATQEANSINITGSSQTLANGISVLFNATTGHTLNDTWDGTVTHREVDLGISGHYNDGSGYTHTGLFRDATDDKWKFFNTYDPEVGTSVNTADGSFGLADIAIKGLDAVSATLTGPITSPSLVANTVTLATSLNGGGATYTNLHPAVTNTGSSPALNFNNPHNTWVLAGNETATYSNLGNGKSIQVVVDRSASGHTPTWPTTKWANDTEPTWADYRWWVVNLVVRSDGSTVLGSATGHAN